MDSKKRNIIIICIVVASIFLVGLIIFLRRKNNQSKKKVDENGKNEIDNLLTKGFEGEVKKLYEGEVKKEYDNELKEFLNYFEKIDENIEIYPYHDLLTNRKKDVKTENGFEIHSNFYLLPNIELTQDLTYRLHDEQNIYIGKKYHKLLSYIIMKRSNFVGIKQSFKIAKN